VIARVGEEVSRELARFGPASGMARLVEAWPAAVGADVARNAWPARLGRNGTLYVHARDSVWAFELTARAEDIRGRLGDSPPSRLVFTPGPLPEPSSEPAEMPFRPPLEPTAEHRAQAESLVRGIRDDELREIVAKTVASGLAAAGSGRSVW
jgi:Dna[CI] antecedent, DciA